MEYLMPLIIIGVIAFLVISAAKAGGGDKAVICTMCKSSGMPYTETKGSFAIELLLWLMFLFPGLVYSIWRLSSRQKVCAVCKSQAIVPVSSPAGMSLIRDNQNGSDTESHGQKKAPSPGIKNKDGINIIDLD